MNTTTHADYYSRHMAELAVGSSFIVGNLQVSKGGDGTIVVRVASHTITEPGRLLGMGTPDCQGHVVAKRLGRFPYKPKPALFCVL